ncbi:hypothetical protein WNY78_13165 [Psychroserpens sp. AS72]|uniref:hypothetical protein n=1 Tax=Psychroserpens sp. AS72 TaxID=3135775 RepID=UPI0031817BA9
MKTIIKLIVLFLIAFTFQNCDNDDDISQQNDDPGLNANDIMFQNENFGNVTTGKFIGLIKNEDGEKLSNVQITIGNSIAFTDQNGFFIINDAEVFENFAYIKAYKDGYVNGSRVVVPKTDGVNRINIVLLEKEVTAIINSGESSVVSLPNGVKVGFNGDFMTSDGSPYNGQVEVVLHSVVPNSNSNFAQMPGSLFAQTTTNAAVGLESYGMFSVNLLSPSGEQLNISENSSASITFPIDSNQLDSAPDTIPLWYFDETVGYWKEEGQAIKSNNKYFGLVSHFSWWNCDLPYDYVNLCFTINSGTTDASTPYVVEIKHNSNQLIFSGDVLSQDGEECGFIPQNEDITISIYSTGPECNYELVHEQVLGSFSSDSSVNVSFSEEFQTTTLSGTVTNCNGNPLTNGYLYIDQYNAFSITNGIIDVALQHCSPSTIPFQIFDFDSSQWTLQTDITLNGETIDLGSLSTCEDSGGIYNGDVTLSTQDEVNDFGLFNYNGISGNLRIGNLDGSDITNLTPLESLVTINGRLSIFNTDLQSFTGLNNIETIDVGLYIGDNNSLISISGFDNLNSIGNLSVYSNQNLESIGLNSITEITESVYIENNDNMTTLDGLNNVSSFITLNLKDNEQLNSISGLSSLTNLFRLFVLNNSSLTNFEGLEQLTSLDSLWILNNAILSDLSGLENITSMTPSTGFPNVLIGYGIITDVYENAPNPNLSDFCALENLFLNGNGSSLEQGVDFVISNNAYNPTIQNILDGNCSL